MAFCSEGLTGIKFIFTNSDSSGWVGDSNGPGIAQGILSIPERLDWYCLLAGLDCFKIVSLGLGKLTGHAGASVKFPSQGVMDSSCVQSHLWTPHPPRHEDLIISTLLPSQPSRAFEPRINIDFGGSRGLLLGSLTRLAFHMASSPYPLIGIEIFYSDGKSVLFGSNSGCEISFFCQWLKWGAYQSSRHSRRQSETPLSDWPRWLAGLFYIFSKHLCATLILIQVSTNYG